MATEDSIPQTDDEVLPDSLVAKFEEQQRIRGQRFRTVYGNNVAVGFSKWDIGITFGEIMGNGEDGKVIIEEIVKVNLTREMAKALLLVLKDAFSEYERLNGKIVLTAEVPPPPS